MTDDVVRAAYSARADEYAALLGSISAMDDLDRQLISGWAARCRGPILDAGCGPGHWTNFLAELGAEVEGVDLVPEFVDLARRRFPATAYRVAGLDDLGVPDGSTGGILAWYSLIHLEPARIPGTVGEFARSLRAGGSLAVGFFTSERLEPFPHAITTAYSWPAEELAQQIEKAGFVVREVHNRPNPDRPDRTHGAILAERV